MADNSIDAVCTADDDVEIVIVADGTRHSLVTLPPDQAGLLGRDLIAAGSLCKSQGKKPAPGSLVPPGAHLVTGWKIGLSTGSNEPVLTLSIEPNLELLFQFPSETAAEVGRLLAKTGDETRKRSGRKLN